MNRNPIEPARPLPGEPAPGSLSTRTDGGAFTAINEEILRQRAREAIRIGKLPERRPDNTWGGCTCVLITAPRDVLV